MDSIANYLDVLEDLLEVSKPKPFSTKVVVDKNAIYQIINEIRLNLPHEVKQAKQVVQDYERVVQEAKVKAQSIIENAENKAIEMGGEHLISIKAKEEANNILDEANKMAREIRVGTVNYADEILAKTEELVRETLIEVSKKFRFLEEELTQDIKMLSDNRQELRGAKVSE